MDPPETVRFYDRVAGRAGRIPFRVLAKRILRLGGSGGKLLDIACGPGHLLLALARLDPGLQLHGLDISPNMLEACRLKLIEKEFKGRVTLHEGSAYELPFENDFFDLVVNTQGLHYMDDAPRFFQELFRVLGPGGRGYVFAYRRDIPRAVRSLAYISSWWRWRRRGIEGIGHVFDASYTPDEVKECLRDLPSGHFDIQQSMVTMNILLNK